ncbi:MAG: nucleotidyltransferase family protein [Chloroflexota bacterium]
MAEATEPTKTTQAKFAIDLPMDRIAEFCRRWQVIEFALFGSVLRDDFRPDSDIDVLVTFAPGVGWSLFDIVHMRDELSEIFGREVDLGERPTLEKDPNYIRRKEILSTVQVIYATRSELSI